LRKICKPEFSRVVFCGAVLCLSGLPLFGQFADRYALVMADPPISARFAVRTELQSPPALNYQAQIEARQNSLTRELAVRHFSIAGANSLLVNAVFVIATPDQEGELASLPGVIGVVRLHRYKRSLNQAIQMLNSTGNSGTAWGLLGGIPNAGKGIRVGVIDSGIDQNHPSLKDDTLNAPAGFPKCDIPANCTNFTNTKVIVARSYVRLLALGTGTLNPAISRPDDYSARDHSGHGTAVATCVAGNTSTGGFTITGMAPKAWLGSYKVFGSPQINDSTSDDVLIAALSDAINDGMDIVTMSIGGPAFTGPLDTGAACGKAAGVPCDLAASAFEKAAGMKGAPLIVVAAGNAGANGLTYPTFGSVASPATAPSVLSVGGVSNSHSFLPAVRVSGSNVPSNLAAVAAQAGDSSNPVAGAQAAPLTDVARLGNDGYACAALPPGSLAASFALIQMGPADNVFCTDEAKMTNAVNAGAAGVIFYDYPGGAFPYSPTGLSNFTQAAVLIDNADGVNLKNFLGANPGYTATIDPSGSEVPVSPANQLVYYSSTGPSLGANGIKPDLLAVAGGGQNGDLIYMGAQSFDPLGNLYSANGYIAAAGTSFATPLTAGAAALVKQRHPEYSAAQIKSALVNSATQDVLTDDSGDPVDVLQTGGGKVAADLAIQTNLTAVPSTVSFGVLASGVASQTMPILLTNTGAANLSLTFAVVSTASSTAAKVALDKTTLTLAPGATGTLNVLLSGTAPAAGLYYGAITVAGGAAQTLRIPWMFLVGSKVAANLTPLLGSGNDAATGNLLPDEFLAFQINDANGVPLAGAAVTFQVNAGSAPVTLSKISKVTDAYGIAYATATLGSEPGTYSVEGCLNTCTNRNQFEFTFSGNVRNAPAIAPGGVVNAAAANAGSPLAPGSYFSIYGTGLSDQTNVTTTAKLPASIDFVNVSFDVPAASLSVPAHLVFISAGQVNAQVPWELQGQTSAQVKVTINGIPGNVVTVPIANYAPGFFEIAPGLVAAIDPLNAANPVITAINAAKRGKLIALFANGLGAVSNQPESGDAASLSVLAQTTTPPTVTIGGQPAIVAFSGLTPGLPGLYQINVTVPNNIGAGTQPVTLTIGGAAAKSSAISVQ
jgi:minor extracellular serine protease Vpr